MLGTGGWAGGGGWGRGDCYCFRHVALGYSAGFLPTWLKGIRVPAGVSEVFGGLFLQAWTSSRLCPRSALEGGRKPQQGPLAALGTTWVGYARSKTPRRGAEGKEEGCC